MKTQNYEYRLISDQGEFYITPRAQASDGNPDPRCQSCGAVDLREFPGHDEARCAQEMAAEAEVAR